MRASSSFVSQKGYFKAILFLFALFFGFFLVQLLQKGPSNNASSPTGPQAPHAAVNVPAGIQLSPLNRQKRTVTRGTTAQTQLVVSGRLKNTLQHPVVLPPLRLVLLNEAGIELDFWPVQWAMNPLPAGETLAFGATFLNQNLENIAHVQPQFGARVNSHIPPIFEEIDLALHF